MKLSSAYWDLCGIDFRVQAPREVLSNLVKYTLRYHSTVKPGEDRRSASIEMIPGDFDDRKTDCLRRPQSTDDDCWVWAIPRTSLKLGPERFYYFILLPIISQVLASMGLCRLHGALLYHEETGGVVVLGPRGAGKSTVAAGWLAGGGLVSTDDTIFVDGKAEEAGFYGLHREIHIDPHLAEVLPTLPGLRTAPEYLPGQGRVAFDWIAHFPDQRIDSTSCVSHVVRSSVGYAESTVARRLSGFELDQLIDSAIRGEAENTAVHDESQVRVREALGQAIGHDIRWGWDIWGSSNKHVGYFKRLGPTNSGTLERPTNG